MELLRLMYNYPVTTILFMIIGGTVLVGILRAIFGGCDCDEDLDEE